MASSCAQKGKTVVEKEVETPVARSDQDATQRSDGPAPAFFIKNVRDGLGKWATDEIKLNISLI